MHATTSDPGPSRIELVTQEPMVNWLAPGQLLRTGVRAAVAATFGEFADGREVQAALHPAAARPALDFSARDALWLDYLADTGDGWDSTYSVAYCVSRDRLDGVAGAHQPLPRGQLLMLGGDQVYPTPAHGGYRTRFLDPFRSALPAPVGAPDPWPEATGFAARAQPPADELVEQPVLLALPGNHDWYDGLRGFNQLFCARQPIGRWRTVQHTSYFAVRLPHGWWLWAVDLQLASSLDAPQRAYFRDVAAPLLRPGERVILCGPEPSWIDESERVRRAAGGGLAALETRSARFAGLQQIETLVANSPATLALVLAGDLHHYAHYTPAAGSGAPHRITCGGGGAYLLGTHDLPASLAFRGGQGYEQTTLGACFPPRDESKRLRDRALWMPQRNLAFCALLGALYLLLAWLLQSGSRALLPLGHSLLEALEAAAAGDVPALLMQVLARQPAAAVVALAMVAGAGVFTRASAREARNAAWLGGVCHGLLHGLLAAGLLTLFAKADWVGAFAGAAPAAGTLASAARALGRALQALLLIGVAGGLLGGTLFGAWLVLANRWRGWHGEEVFSSQSIADDKSFLRLRIDATGLTVYALKIERVCRRWKLGPGVEAVQRSGRSWRLRCRAGSGARFEPDGAPITLALIEPPIHLGAAPAAGPAPAGAPEHHLK